MIERLHIRPAFAGAVIRDPRSRRPLPESGAEVEASSYWRRRLVAGDVVLVEAAPPAPPAKVRAKVRRTEAPEESGE